MGIIKKIRQKIYNGKEWDTLHPETESEQVLLSDGRNASIINKMGKVVTLVDGSKCINVGGDVWCVLGRTVTGSAEANYKSANWQYDFPKELKCIEILGVAQAISTNNGDFSGLTNGYCVDTTPANVNNYISGQCYDMTPGKPTRIRLMFYMRSSM